MTKLFVPEAHGTCPHCGKEAVLIRAQFFDHEQLAAVNQRDAFRIDRDQPTVFAFSRCPACNRSIAQVVDSLGATFVVPRIPFRRPLGNAVPAALVSDYREALLVLPVSPKASAALSRRCLQSLLVLQGTTKRDLVDQIDELRPTLPSYVADYVDHVRELGNISAHAKQSKATGEIVDVEPGEAEWMLELLEELFDHYYTKPAESAAKQSALKAKFADISKLRPAQNPSAP